MPTDTPHLEIVANSADKTFTVSVPDSLRDQAKLKKALKDLGFCGISFLETGKWDPYWKFKTCPNHDTAFNELKDKLRSDYGFKVTWKFFRDSTSVFLKSAYGVVAYVPYLLLGGVVGLGRWTYLRYKNNIK